MKKVKNTLVAALAVATLGIGTLNAGTAFAAEDRPENLLEQAVVEGKFTHEQADQVITKYHETQRFLNGLKGIMEGEERANTIAAFMDELRQWAHVNSIPMEFIGWTHLVPSYEAPVDDTATSETESSV